MIISAVIIISYTCTGGFLAASTTDLIQSIIMTIALVSIVIFGVSAAGGLGNVVDNAQSLEGYFSLSNIHNTETGGADKYSLLTIASLLAWDQNSSVFRVVSFAWAGFGATFGPVMLAALFWKRSNRWGAIAGLVVSAVMVFLWKYATELAGFAGIELSQSLRDLFSIYELLPAFLCAFAAIIIVSLVTGAPEKEITEEFDRVKVELGE